MTAAALAGAPAGVAAAGDTRIEGQIQGLSSGASVLLLTLEGHVFGNVGDVGPSGTFTITVPPTAAAKIRNATLQTISPSDRYAGPVVLRESPEKGNPACNGHGHGQPLCIDDAIGLSTLPRGGAVNVGVLQGENDNKNGEPTWFLGNAPRDDLGTNVIRAAASNGEPYGAGNFGLRKRGIPDVCPDARALAGRNSPARVSLAAGQSYTVVLLAKNRHRGLAVTVGVRKPGQHTAVCASSVNKAHRVAFTTGALPLGQTTITFTHARSTLKTTVITVGGARRGRRAAAAFVPNGADDSTAGAAGAAGADVVELPASPYGGYWLPTATPSPAAAHDATDSEPSNSENAAVGAYPSIGTYSEACPSTADPAIEAISRNSAGTDPGQELDCSGVPNVLNVDVSGNGALNVADSSPVTGATSTLTISSRLDASPMPNTALGVPQPPPGEIWANNSPSYYAPTLASRFNSEAAAHATIAEWFIHDFLSLGVVVPQHDLFPSDTSNDVQASVDCSGINWCENAEWITWFQSGGAPPAPWSKTTPPYALQDSCDFSSNPSSCPGPNGLNPFLVHLLPIVDHTGNTDYLNQLQPGQVLTVNAQSASAGSASVPLELAPYFVTTPYIANTSFVFNEEVPAQSPAPHAPILATDSAGVAPNASGVITLSVDRPERLALPGESSTTGLMDQSGLLYAVAVTQLSSLRTSHVGLHATACPASAYAIASGASLVEVIPSKGEEQTTGVGARGITGFGTYLADSTTSDFDPAAPGNPGPITFKLNLAACLGSSESWNPSDAYYLEVSAYSAQGIGGPVVATSEFLLSP
jgi:hypothetical protein